MIPGIEPKDGVLKPHRQFNYQDVGWYTIHQHAIIRKYVPLRSSEIVGPVPFTMTLTADLSDYVPVTDRLEDGQCFVGTHRINTQYYERVRKEWPGCQWYECSETTACVIAKVDGHLVALVAPIIADKEADDE